MRIHVLLPIIVLASLGAGVVAFERATPDQSSRVAVDELGFRELNSDSIQQRLNASGDVYRAQHQRTVRARVAAATARRWLESLPTTTPNTAAIRGIVVEGDQLLATRRLAALQVWADGVAPATWSIVSVAADQIADDPGWVVDAVVHVKLAQARARTRTLRLPIVVQVAPPRKLGAAWRVQDVQVDGARRWLRAYRDPVVVRRGVADVVAPTVARRDADLVATVIANRLPTMRDRYAAISGASNVTAWMVDDTAQAREVFGPKHGMGTGDPTHPLVATTQDGDLVIDLYRWRTAGAQARSSAVAHALWHAATLDGTEQAPASIVEGLADIEAATTRTLGQDLLALVAGARPAQERTIEQLLIVDADASLTAPDRARSRAFAAWLLDVHGPRRAATLLARIDSGLNADHAIRKELGATPRGVEQRVREWARVQILSTEEDATNAPDATPGAESL